MLRSLILSLKNSEHDKRVPNKTRATIEFQNKCALAAAAAQSHQSQNARKISGQRSLKNKPPASGAGGQSRQGLTDYFHQVRHQWCFMA
jgi:hypothetical protein